jgi:hypothetical protein
MVRLLKSAASRARTGARLEVERGEQVGSAVTQIVGSTPLRLAGAHRQQRLTAIECPDLALLVDAQHQRAVGGQAFSRGALYTLLRNPIYVGEIRHKGVCHPGQHAPTVDRAMWDKVAQLLRGRSTGCGARNSRTKSCVLIGKLFDESGEGLTVEPLMSANKAVTVLRSPSTVAEASGCSGVTRISEPVAALPSAVPQSSQNADEDAFSAPHFGQRLGSGLPHAAQNFLLLVLSVPHLLQRIALPAEPSDSLFLYHPASGRTAGCARTIALHPIAL